MITSEKRLLIKIARYYYHQSMTQDQIAKKLSMSRQKVNRIIGTLVEKGIITIKINGYEESCVDLEERLEKTFNLKQAIVIKEDKNIIEELGSVTAEYLENIIKDDMYIGVSWGKTLATVAQKISVMKKENISVLQCVGGKNVKDTSIMTDEITRVISNKLNANPYFLYAPAIVKDKNTREIIRNEETVKNVFNEFKKCNIALVGVGSINEDSTLSKYEFLMKDEIKSLCKKGCVGDICFMPFDINGMIVETDIKDRVIGIDDKSLMNIPLVVGVAGGSGKEKAILGALRSGFIDVIITDERSAKYSLNIV